MYTIDKQNKTASLQVKENILTVSIWTNKFSRCLKEYHHNAYGRQNEFDRLFKLIVLVCRIENIKLSSFSISRYPVTKIVCPFDSGSYKKGEVLTLQDICASTQMYNNFVTYCNQVLSESNTSKSKKKKVIKYTIIEINSQYNAIIRETSEK